VIKIGANETAGKYGQENNRKWLTIEGNNYGKIIFLRDQGELPQSMWELIKTSEQS
jgi:hypothetical protein